MTTLRQALRIVNTISTTLDTIPQPRYTHVMPKTKQIAVRMTPEIKAAIERAAADDLRSVSSMVEKIVSEWVRENGLVRKGRGK